VMFKQAFHLLLEEHTSKTKDSLKRAAQRRTQTLEDMQVYIHRAQIEKFDRIPLIHITGTKGKGSTAAISESILRNVHNYRTGLFTSPHLLDIRERIRLDGKPVSKEEFADAYFTLRHRLLKCSTRNNEDNDDLPPLPGYFRMLTLMALYIFTTHTYPPENHLASLQGVDIIIMEVGMGGRYDATNLFNKAISKHSRPFSAGVALIDLDHTRVLGDTVEKIAWEKGGIFRHSEQPTPVDITKRFFTIETNTKNVIEVLEKCCLETYEKEENRDNDDIQACESLEIVQMAQGIPSDWSIGLKGIHQRLNAELAYSLCKSIHSQTTWFPIHDTDKDGIILNYRKRNISSNPNFDSGLLKKALHEAFWPGRCQTISLPNTSIKLHCDGAHTVESMKECVKWLRIATEKAHRTQKDGIKRILIFNCSHERNPVPLLNYLLSINDNESAVDDTNSEFFSKVYFCRADSERPSMVAKASAMSLLLDAGYDIENLSTEQTEKGTWQDTLARIWTFMLNLRQLQKVPSDGSLKANVVTNKTVKKALHLILEENMTDNSSFSTKYGDINIHICVTGSLYIVGSALQAAGWEEISSPPSHV